MLDWPFLMDILVVFICLINAVTAVSSVISNGFVFLAIVKTRSLHIPSNVLLCGLAMSDFAVSLVVQPLFIAYLIPGSEHKEQARKLFRTFGLFFSAVSVGTMVAISLDRFLALYLHIKYYRLVTVKRTVVLLLLLWLFDGIWLPAWVFSNREITSAVVIPITSMYFLTLLVCYIKIFLIVRRHRRQIADQYNSLNVPIPRQGKTITTSIYIHSLFIICLVPILISNAFSLVLGDTQTASHLLYVSWTIFFTNSSLNPHLYCYRMRDIKKAVVPMAKSVFCWRFIQSKREEKER